MRRVNDLQDEKVRAALLTAEGDSCRLAALQQPPHNPAKGTVDGNHFDKGSQRHFMCPDLYRAAVSGSVDRVSELLGLSEEIARIYKFGPDSTYVKVLLENTCVDSERLNEWGGSVHGDGRCTLQEVTAEKNTVLHIAVAQGHLELVEEIIRRDNSLLLLGNSRRETPLHLAARAGNRHIVSRIVLLAQESGVGAYEVLTKRSMEGDTVLHEAARHGHRDVVKVVMKLAPALSAEVNNASMSPLYLAVVRKSIGVVKELLQYSHASALGPNQQNALHAAVLGSQEIASMLLDWKPDLANERDAFGSTPMHYAASNDNVTAVKSMLWRVPLAVYVKDQEGSSPLHVAARMRNYSAISCMIEYCPDSFEIRDNHGRNFLHIMARHGGGDSNLNRHDLKKLTCLFDLVSRSPDLKMLVNERDIEGNTPLHFASMNGFSEVILQLLKKTEADTTVMNNTGKTALDNAISLSSFFRMAGVVATLSAYGAIFSPQRQDKLKNWTDKTKKWIDRVSKNLIVVSVLIATIAFSAAFNVPGSYNNDGVASLRKKNQYITFLILDSIAMSTSVSAAVLLVVAKSASNKGSWNCFSISLLFLWVSLFTMELAFVLAISVTLGYSPRRQAAKSIIHSVCVTFFCWTVMAIHNNGSPAKFGTIRKFLSSMKEQTHTMRQIDIQFPKLVSYVKSSNLFVILNLFFCFATMAIMWTVPWFD